MGEREQEGNGRLGEERAVLPAPHISYDVLASLFWPSCRLESTMMFRMVVVNLVLCVLGACTPSTPPVHEVFVVAVPFSMKKESTAR